VLLTYTLSEKQYLDAQRAFNAHLGRGRLFFRMVLPIAIGAVVAGAYSFFVAGNQGWGIGLCLASAYLLANRTFWWKRRVRRALEENPERLGTFELELTEKGIKFSPEALELSWSVLRRYYGVGIVCMMLNSQNRRLGDYVAGTVVVHDKRTEEVKPDWNTVTESAAANPQLSLVTSEELVLIESYLHRRVDMDLILRNQVAYKIASRITEKTELQRGPNQSLDDFLETSARQIRDTARFR